METVGNRLSMRGPEGVRIGVDDDEVLHECEFLEHLAGCTPGGVQHKEVIVAAALIAEALPPWSHRAVSALSEALLKVHGIFTTTSVSILALEARRHGPVVRVVPL